MTMHQLISTILLILLLLSAKVFSGGNFGSDTCMEGFVWREALAQSITHVSNSKREIKHVSIIKQLQATLVRHIFNHR